MTQTSLHTKLLIIGGGPAGYTAAIYAARANLNPVLVEGMQPGGQLTVTTDVENFPGFAAPVQGPWLMEQMKEQAKHVGTEIISDHITKVDLRANPKKAWGDGGAEYTADTIVIATGAQARWLGIASEPKFRGFGVSACATCDGFFYKGRKVAVVGGGNSAMEEAMFLTNFATEVTIIHRRDQFRGEKIMQDRVFKNPKIKVIWDSVVDELKGTENPTSLTTLVLKNVKTGALSELAADGLFVAIGHDPATSLFKGQLKMDEAGYIITAPDSTATDIEGVYAAGDVKDKIFRQAVTAAGMGCMAALEAERWLAARHDEAEAA
jgi:thioredoxin reductase (NADPH)